MDRWADEGRGGTSSVVLEHDGDVTLKGIPTMRFRAPAEAALVRADLVLPRLVTPDDAQCQRLAVSLSALAHQMDRHVSSSQCAIDMERMNKAYER